MLDAKLDEIFKELEAMSPEEFEHEMREARKSPWYPIFCEIFKEIDTATTDENATSGGRG